MTTYSCQLEQQPYTWRRVTHYSLILSSSTFVYCLYQLPQPSLYFHSKPLLFLVPDHKFYSPTHPPLFYFGSEFPHNLNLNMVIRNQTSTSKIIPSLLTATHHSQSDALAHLSHKILLMVSVTLLTFQAVVFHCPNENLPMNVMHIVLLRQCVLNTVHIEI